MRVDSPARIPANTVVVRASVPLSCPCTVGEDGEGLFVGFPFMKIVSCKARSRVLGALLAAIASGGVHAQSSVTLPDMVVTATRSPQLLTAVVAHTTVITREDIERSQAVDLITLLEREAGLQRTQNGGLGTTSSVFLRGAPSLQTLVLIDGVPQNKQDASGAVSLEHVMLDNVERVEIVRGNVSAVYGSGAIGGVIQIFTRGYSPRNLATVSAEIGPRGTSKLALDTSLVAGDTSLQLGLSRVKTEGFSAVNTAQFPGANPDADGYENASAHVSLTHTLANGHQIGMRLVRSRADTDFDNYFGAPQDIQTLATTLQQASVFSANQWGRWNSRVTLSHNTEKSSSVDTGTYGSTEEFQTASDVLNWVNTVGLNDNFTLTAGLDQQNQHVDTASSSPYNTPYDQGRTLRAVFVGLEGQWDAASVQINMRNDEWAGTSKATGYLGVGYAWTPHWKATASTSTAFNAPPLGYLFAPGYGNPLLKPELATSDELGLQYAHDGHLLRATYFDTRVQDQLNFDTTTFTFANVDRTRNRGLELSYRGALAMAQWRASLTLQNPVNESTGALLQRRAKQLASVGVFQTVAAWQWGANLRWSGPRDDLYSDPVTFSTVAVQLPSYSVVDLTAAYQWSPTVKLTARLDNALDATYQTVYGFAQQPRSLYAGITWSPRR